MTIETEYDFGDEVYLTTDPDQDKHIITGFTVRKGQVLYGCTFCNRENWHYDFELSRERDMVLKTS